MALKDIHKFVPLREREALARIEAKGIELHRYREDGTEMSYEEHELMHPKSNTGFGNVEKLPPIGAAHGANS